MNAVLDGNYAYVQPGLRKSDLFVSDSLVNGKIYTSKRQIIIGRFTGYFDKEGHCYYEPLYWNKEWATHNYHGSSHDYRMHQESPMYMGLVKVTEEEAEAARMVLL